jgi:hypothetical protein
MSIGYRNRKKAIKRAKKRLENIDRLDPKGHIPTNAFNQMRADWRRKIDGPPLGSLGELLRSSMCT